MRQIGLKLVLVATIIAAGLVLRAVADGPLAKYGGVALYAALVYVLAALVWPRARPGELCAIAGGVCLAIELFQLTPVPARLAGVHPVFALVLGTTFHRWDLAAYAAGSLAAAGCHSLARRANVNARPQ